MNNHELAKIVKQVQQNKEKHFEKLFNEIYQIIYYISYQLLGNEPEAEDASQDIILYIYDHIGELKAAESFNTWMNRIIYSKCINRQKQYAVQKSQLQTDVNEHIGDHTLEDGPEQFIQIKEKSEIVLGVIDELPKKQKEVVLLYYYQELSAKEIAEILSCSLEAVKNRLFKAKRSIKGIVENSKELQTYNLRSLGAIPLVIQLMRQELQELSTMQVQQRLWNRVHCGISRHNHQQSDDLKPDSSEGHQNGIEPNNKTYTFKFGFVAGFVILFLTVVFISYGNLSNKQKRYDETTNISDSIADSEFSFFDNTIRSNDGNSKVSPAYDDTVIEEQVNVPASEELVLLSETVQPEEDSVGESNRVAVDQESSATVMDTMAVRESDFLSAKDGGSSVTTDFEWQCWNKNSDDYQIINEARLEDKENEDLQYHEDAEDRSGADAVYREEEYKSFSEITYHNIALPIIEYVKIGSLDNGSVVRQGEIITYRIIIKNVGEVTANYIILRDDIPQLTTLIADTIMGGRNSTEVLVRETEETESLIWIIHELQPGETVEVSFQVEISDEIVKNEAQIKNIAKINVLSKTEDIYADIENEEAFDNSNEVIYLVNDNQNIQGEPKTGDHNDLTGLLMLGIIASVAIIFLNSGDLIKVGKKK